MRIAFDDKDTARWKTKIAIKDMKKFTWKAAAEKMIKYLERLE